jgi:hypothetical protein
MADERVHNAKEVLRSLTKSLDGTTVLPIANPFEQRFVDAVESARDAYHDMIKDHCRRYDIEYKTATLELPPHLCVGGTKRKAVEQKMHKVVKRAKKSKTSPPGGMTLHSTHPPPPPPGVVNQRALAVIRAKCRLLKHKAAAAAAATAAVVKTVACALCKKHLDLIEQTLTHVQCADCRAQAEELCVHGEKGVDCEPCNRLPSDVSLPPSLEHVF